LGEKASIASAGAAAYAERMKRIMDAVELRHRHPRRIEAGECQGHVHGSAQVQPVMPGVRRPDLSRTLRALGARPGSSAAETRHRREALAMLAREPLIAPAFIYRIHPARIAGGGMIEVGQATLHAPIIAGEPGDLLAIAAAACTLGAALQERISRLFATRRRSLALALDTIGSELLFRLTDRSVAAIRRDARRKGMDMGMEISPGDPGLPLDLQTAVLALAGSCPTHIAVTCAGMLAPVQSLSLLVTLGQNLRRRSAAARCKACPSGDRCTVN